MTPQNELRFTKETIGGTTNIDLDGVINERTNLEHIFDGIEGEKIIINLRHVKRINSCGVREWINAVRKLGDRFEIDFIECSRAIVDQLNMIKNFYSSGRVLSFFAGYCCEECEEYYDMLLDVEKYFSRIDGAPDAPEMNCPKCGAKMIFHEDEEEYFSFLYDV